MMHETYLPFSEQELLNHFADVRTKGKCVKNTEHLKCYLQSIKRYTDYLDNNPSRLGKPLKETRAPCQIEKDERFWIAACMMTVFHSGSRKVDLAALFEKAFGKKPPVNVESWEECFEGDLHLFFETKLPSPRVYKKWLRDNFAERDFIPYIKDSAASKRNLEGPTNVDAVLLNSQSGFAALVEAKVLSDISYGVMYDCMRNQIARNIDVMLEDDRELCPPLNRREPEKTLFLLVTPRVLKQNPMSRLYGYKFNEYKKNPEAIAKDLPHRESSDWRAISLRLGWTTWEDFRTINKDCGRWL